MYSFSCKHALWCEDLVYFAGTLAFSQAPNGEKSIIKRYERHTHKHVYKHTHKGTHTSAWRNEKYTWRRRALTHTRPLIIDWIVT